MNGRPPRLDKGGIVDDYRSGMSFSQVAEKHQCNASYCHDVVTACAPEIIRPQGHYNHTNTTWTPARVEELTALAAAGKTARQIADALGYSRSAVIAKITRAKIDWQHCRVNVEPKPYKRRKPSAGPPKSPTTRSHSWLGAMTRILNDKARSPKEIKALPLAPELPPEPVPETRVTLMQLTETTCRWPHGDPVEYFCGGAIEHGRVYCAHHVRMGYIKTRWVPT
jgi:GcrA cell cycle regulator